jgi:hypothetical protein
MSGLGVLLVIILACGGCFIWGILVGVGWRFLDAVEARLLDKIKSLQPVPVVGGEDNGDA